MRDDYEAERNAEFASGITSLRHQSTFEWRAGKMKMTVESVATDRKQMSFTTAVDSSSWWLSSPCTSYDHGGPTLEVSLSQPSRLVEASARPVQCGRARPVGRTSHAAHTPGCRCCAADERVWIQSIRLSTRR